MVRFAGTRKSVARAQMTRQPSTARLQIPWSGATPNNPLESQHWKLLEQFHATRPLSQLWKLFLQLKAIDNPQLN